MTHKLLDKCIKVWGTRQRNNEFIPDIPRERTDTVVEALTFLMHEFNYGAHVIERSVDENTGELTIVTRVRAFGSLDTTYFKGDPEKMQPLVDAIVYHYGNGVQFMRALDADFLPEEFAAAAAQSRMVRPHTRKTIFHICEVPVEHWDAGQTLKSEDLNLALVVWLEDGGSFADLVQVIA